MSTSRLDRALALGLAFVAVGAPAAAAQQDLRNPDNRRPVTTAQPQDLRMPDRRAPAPPTQPQDLRMPDRRAPAPPASPPRTYRDLRSPDARDQRRVVTVPGVPAVAEPDFDFGDAAIGAGVLAALIALAATASLTVRRRRGVMPVH